MRMHLAPQGRQSDWLRPSDLGFVARREGLEPQPPAPADPAVRQGHDGTGFGRRRVNAARTARSGQEERGRLTCRRKTATSWRKTRISAFLDACARASSPSQPKSWQKIR
jgi:hypothetical protein